MKISTKGRYALQLMLDLAMEESGKPVSIKDVAGRHEISEKYLEQIISTLNKGGYVKSIRGAQGGYVLAKEPAEYTVGDVFRLTEGDISTSSCTAGDAKFCEYKSRCATVKVFDMINDAVNNVVDNITLADLVKWQKNL